MKIDPVEQHALNRGAQGRLRSLQNRFRATHGWRFNFSHILSRCWRQVRYWLIPALLGVGVGLGGMAFYDLAKRFDSVELAVRHLAAARDCDAARAAGLAPSLRGRPGYWAMHDRDGDGIACEPYRAP